MRPIFRSIELVSDVGDTCAAFNVTTYNIHLLIYNMVSNIFISMSKYTFSVLIPIDVVPEKHDFKLECGQVHQHLGSVNSNDEGFW